MSPESSQDRPTTDGIPRRLFLGTAAAGQGRSRSPRAGRQTPPRP